MKKISIILGMAFVALIMMASTPVDTPSRKDTKGAKKEAKRLTKEGFVTMGLPLESQLASYYTMVREVNDEGEPKYLQESAIATANTYNTAEMEAKNVAKVRLAQQIQTMVLSEAKIYLANQQMSADEAASYSKALEKSTLMMAQKLNRVIIGQDYYRVLKNKNYEVHVVLLYDCKSVRNMILEDAREELKNDLDNFSPEYEMFLKDIVNKGVKGSNEIK